MGCLQQSTDFSVNAHNGPDQLLVDREPPRKKLTAPGSEIHQINNRLQLELHIARTGTPYSRVAELRSARSYATTVSRDVRVSHS
jgi:hypothetical protein